MGEIGIFETGEVTSRGKVGKGALWEIALSKSSIFSLRKVAPMSLWESINLSNFTDVRIERVASTPPNR